MKDFLAAGLIAMAIAALVMALMGIFGAFFGGIAGFFFGYFFDESGLILREWLSVPDGATWYEIGAVLGFVGGFFKSTQTNSGKN